MIWAYLIVAGVIAINAIPLTIYAVSFLPKTVQMTVVWATLGSAFVGVAWIALGRGMAVFLAVLVAIGLTARVSLGIWMPQRFNDADYLGFDEETPLTLPADLR